MDLSRLNKHVRRERYQSPTPAEEVAPIVGKRAQWFTVVDAAKGYHQCVLAEESRLLTTFTTPFGRYAFKRAPYGVASISEHYNRRMDEALQGMSENYRKVVVDDVVIFSSTLEDTSNMFESSCHSVRSEESPSTCRSFSWLSAP